MRKTRNFMWLLVYVLIGAVLGGILGDILSQINGLHWIKLGGTNGYRELFSVNYNPLINTNFLKLELGLTIRVNFGNIIGIITGLILYLQSRNWVFIILSIIKK